MDLLRSCYHYHVDLQERRRGAGGWDTLDTQGAGDTPDTVTTNQNCHCGADEDRAALCGGHISEMPK